MYLGNDMVVDVVDGDRNRKDCIISMGDDCDDIDDGGCRSTGSNTNTGDRRR
jgi:hypothetical protein